MMKLQLLAAAAAAATLALAGCDRDNPRVTPDRPAVTPPQSTAPATPPAADRTVGEAAGDAAVTAKVKAALLAEKGVDGMRINVDTRDGNVVLRGNVPEPAQVERASQVARGIEGVKAVDNQLRVGAS